MLERRFADQFETLRDSDYYTIPKERLDRIHYSKIAKLAKANIYIMRKFDDADVEKAFNSHLTENQRYYREHGYLILRKFIPGRLIDAYLRLRKQLGFGLDQFKDSTPYVEHPEILNIVAYKPLMDVIRELHQCEMGLIFTLTGFESTQRGWHQDAYLDPNEVLPRLASWIACGAVDEDVGPFEYIPGSHRWLALDNQQINGFLKPDYRWPEGHRARKSGVPGWGRIAEPIVDPAVFNKMDREGLQSREFTAEKGDVLLWYGRLMHRGSPPRRAGAERPGVIGHYAPLFEKDRGYFAVHPKTGVHYIVPPHKLHLLKRA